MPCFADHLRLALRCAGILFALGLAPFGQAREIRTVPELGIELVKLDAGKFVMGSPRSDIMRFTDEPTQVEIGLSKDFWIGKTEVTQRQWEALMGNNPSVARKAGPEAPVEFVSWEEATAFCAKLTARERAAGRLPEGYVYSLPTEAQWEYACRAGTTEAHAGNLDEMAWYSRNAGIHPHPVAQKQPNAWGIYDMHGNVWEWTADWYRASVVGGRGRGPAGGGAPPAGTPAGSAPGAGGAADDATDPAGAVEGTLRVLRGGAYNMPDAAARSAYRLRLEPETKLKTIGFRVALIVPVAPKPEPAGGGRRRVGPPPVPADPNAVLEVLATPEVLVPPAQAK
ncbi:MAG: formylglycine-generating enzyme family protein [Opitutaceae bacterium]